jgi:hypothetical protein
VSSYSPLCDPESEVRVIAPSLDRAIAQAREVLDEKGRANIHDRDEMIRAAYGLHFVLRDLLAALDAEGAR